MKFLNRKKRPIKEVLERFKGYEVVEKLIWLFAIFLMIVLPQNRPTLKDVVLAGVDF